MAIEKCTKCGGAGTVSSTQRHMITTGNAIMACPECNGLGAVEIQVPPKTVVEPTIIEIIPVKETKSVTLPLKKRGRPKKCQ